METTVIYSLHNWSPGSSVVDMLVYCLGDLGLPRKSMVRLTDRPDMTLAVYCGRKTTIQQQQYSSVVNIKNGC